MKRLIKFFRLWVYYGDRKEAWQDAKFIHNKEIQKEMKDITDKL